MGGGFDIAYELHDAGWASVSVAYNGQSFKQAVSYLHDSLGDLAALGVALQNGGRITEQKVLFLDEPGELALLAYAEEGSPDAELLLLHSADWFFSFGFTARGQETLWRGRVPRHELAGKIHRILHHLYCHIGEAEYLRRWGEHPFPSEGYLKLHEQLKWTLE
ncbi:hypothetical protein A7P95_10080 [Eikenella longinqua]|uniref:Uncharacterized protein n=2 Tax=Eikenella TaxID=538 RepID=A0A1A9RUS2_9NEIS|nr:hypothetical protein [Eikenella longinqua]OAM26053.1 hypothetical protein A7P95_10080 [Eikenella longinqua]